MKRKAKGRKPMSFKEWLDAMPDVKGGTRLITCTMGVTLTVSDWFMLRESALRHRATMEEIASSILRSSDELCELSTSGR